MRDVSDAEILLCPMSKPREANIPREGHVTNTHVIVNRIRSCDCIRVLLKVLRTVYDRMIVLGQYCKN